MADTILDRFTNQPTVLLTTFKRDGTPVGTPVSIAVDGDHAYVKSWSTAGKTKRIRNNGHATVAPSTFRGRPTGEAIGAEARLIEGIEAERAKRLLRRKHPFAHGLLVPVAHWIARNQTVYFRLEPTAK